MFVGCSAGFMNVPKIKGTHNAMKSGMLAAESAYEVISEEKQETEGYEPKSYVEKIQNSWIWKELKAVRNVRPSFHNPLGFYGGMAYSGFTIATRGKEPWTFKHGGKRLEDHKQNVIYLTSVKVVDIVTIFNALKPYFKKKVRIAVQIQTV